jgi:hypothetical protein
MKNIILCNICLMTLKNYIEDFFAGEIQWLNLYIKSV